LKRPVTIIKIINLRAHREEVQESGGVQLVLWATKKIIEQTKLNNKYSREFRKHACIQSSQT
jgi:hypothetical protein